MTDDTLPTSPLASEDGIPGSSGTMLNESELRPIIVRRLALGRCELLERLRAIGIPLTDADRNSWLKILREIIIRALAKSEFSALTCSALKAKYRDELAAGDLRVKFVHLTGSQDLIAERLKNRRGHFMPPALLESQFEILEPPSDALVFSCKKSPKKIVAELIHVLGIAIPD